MDTWTALVMVVLLLILCSTGREEKPDRIPNWEKRSREDKGLRENPLDHREAEREYRR